MDYDEAQRIAESITRTVPETVARVLQVYHNNMSQQWEVKVDELGPASGAHGRGILLWIKTPKEAMSLQKYWLRLARKETL